MGLIQKIFKNSKRCKTPLDSLPDEILALIFSNINQYDAMHIGLLNKKLNQLVSAKLFKSLNVYLVPYRIHTSFEMRKSKMAYSPLMTKYTFVNGYDNLNLIIDMPQFRLVKNVLLSNFHSDYYSDCWYYHLTEECPWITVEVQSFHNDIVEKQFSRIDRISQLDVKNSVYLNPNIEYNVSIKRLNILGSIQKHSDPLALIPKLKNLTALFICDTEERNILRHFRVKGISGLKLKELALRVTGLSIQEMDQVFVLNEIGSLELFFYKMVDSYDDLKWLCTKMPKLGNISVGWPNLLFERVMNSLSDHKFYEIELRRYCQDQLFTQMMLVNLLQAHTSLTQFTIHTRTEFIYQTWENVMFHDGTKLLKYFRKMKNPNLTPLDSLPAEVLALIFSNINQYDAMNIRLLNKNLNKLASVRLFNSIYLISFRTRLKSPFKIKNSKSALMIKYTVVHGYDNFRQVLAMPQLQLVKNVVFVCMRPSDCENYCYTYLHENCPWITVDVNSYNTTMVEKQFSRINRISKLHLHNQVYFDLDIENNVSIKRLNILGSRHRDSDPLAVIPKLKSLTALFICETAEINILGHFKMKGIWRLKLKQLELRVPQLSIREMDQVFELNEIGSLELYFYRTSDAYDDLIWLFTKMPKLRNISVGWIDVSFERVMHSLSGHKFYEMEIKRYGPQQNFTELEVVNLIQSHASLTRFSIYTGTESVAQIWEFVRFHGATKLLKYLKNKKIPNLVMYRINFDAYNYE
ncbi:hypothetical protein JA1_001063 [Spathaspora sp. JA1]|nr:hypothetical protein JA1_001063 [Spathaspora sp. JA1]